MQGLTSLIARLDSMLDHVDKRNQEEVVLDALDVEEAVAALKKLLIIVALSKFYKAESDKFALQDNINDDGTSTVEGLVAHVSSKFCGAFASALDRALE